MREAAVTVREAGLEPWSAAGTAERQAWVADLADAGLFGKKRGTPVRPQRRLARRGRPDPRSPQGPDGELTRCRRFEKTPGWLDWCAAPEQAALHAAAGRGRRALPRVRPGRASSLTRPSASTRPATRARTQLFALRDHLGFDAQRRSCRPPATAPTTARWSTRCRASGRPGARRRHRPPRRHRRASCGDLHEAGVRGVRFNFVKRLVDFTPRDELTEIAARIAPLGWHVVIYFEARGPARAVGLLHRAADDRRRRPHGPARRDASRSTAPSSSCSCDFMREHENVWTQGQLPRAPVGHRPAGARRRAQRLPRRRAVRPPRRRDLPRPRAVGHRLAAPEPEGPHARRRPAGRLHPAHRDHARAAAASCWSTTRCASTGPKSRRH